VTSCIVDTAPPFILKWSNLEILFDPLHRSSPFIGGLRCQAIQMEHGPYTAERTQKAVYVVKCLWCRAMTEAAVSLNIFFLLVISRAVTPHLLRFFFI
jgi:hypothetical protein